VTTGRRPGKVDTRAEILAAAHACFHHAGYDATSVRAVSRKAGVDPALVYHYFPGGKAELFAAAMRMAGDPRRVLEAARQEGEGGTSVVRNFLTLFEGPEAEARGASFLSLAQAMASSPAIAQGMKQFLRDRVWSLAGDCDDPHQDTRHAMVCAELMGLAWVRYILRLEPLLSADGETVAAWFGPILDAIASRPFAAAGGNNGPVASADAPDPPRLDDRGGAAASR
jgi:AcrR family transcriptional regulator